MRLSTCILAKGLIRFYGHYLKEGGVEPQKAEAYLPELKEMDIAHLDIIDEARSFRGVSTCLLPNTQATSGHTTFLPSPMGRSGTC